MFVAEAQAMAPRVDGVISVVRAKTNNRGLLQRMRDELRKNKAEHLGVVLNAVRRRAAVTTARASRPTMTTPETGGAEAGSIKLTASDNSIEEGSTGLGPVLPLSDVRGVKVSRGLGRSYRWEGFEYGDSEHEEGIVIARSVRDVAGGSRRLSK